MHIRNMLVSLGLIAGACSSSTSGPSHRLIDSSGGRLGVDDGASVEVPPGAVDRPTRFSIRSRAGADSLPEGVHALHAMVTFGPEGQSFAVPVRITVPASAEPMVLLTRPHADEPWIRVDGAVWNSERGVVVAEVTHFSDFVPVEREVPVHDDGGLPSDGGDTAIDRDSGIDCSDPRFAGYPECSRGYECDLFEGGCAGYANCYPPDDTTTHGVCSSSGGTFLGGPCTFLSYDDVTECYAGLRCDATELGMVGFCRQVCDDAHSCDDVRDDDPATIYECLRMTTATAAFGFCEPVGRRCIPSDSYERAFECTDGIDSDCDGAIDCNDSDCSLLRACVESTCDPLGSGGCDADAHCVLHAASASVDSPVVGDCMPNGAGAEGTTCTTGDDCGAGLSCGAIAGSSTGLGSESHYYFTVYEGYFSRGEGICVRLCEGGTWTRSSCPPDEICHEISEQGYPSGYGACHVPRDA